MTQRVLELERLGEHTTSRPHANGEANKLRAEDRPVHDWYRFVLSYPPHFVREYVQRLGLDESHTVLDPFCGTGTTLVECKKLGIPSVGLEVNPTAHLASRAKTDWSPDPAGLLKHAREVAEAARSDNGQILRTLAPELMGLLLRDSISPVPLHKTLVLRDCLASMRDERFELHEALALAKTLVFPASNLHFGPEVGVGKLKQDAPVAEAWLEAVRAQAEDLPDVQDRGAVPCRVHRADSRRLLDVLEPQSVDAVITSPPYPNEKDYTRTTRLESVILGFIQSKADLRALKGRQVRSNTRSVYKVDSDHIYVAGHPEIDRIAAEIEARRVELGKTSGFERLYARVTKLYFGGMARHLSELRTALRPGARLAYVVGDQASYLRIMIRTGKLLAGIAESLGYEVMGIDLFRTRLATATREQLREEVLLLRWPG
jgi:hypothetical protein